MVPSFGPAPRIDGARPADLGVEQFDEETIREHRVQCGPCGDHVALRAIEREMLLGSDEDFLVVVP